MATMDKKTQINVWYFVAAFVGLMLFQYWYSSQAVEAVPYSEFQTLLKGGKIAEVTVTENYIDGELKEPLSGGQKFVHARRVEPEFADELAKYDVKISAATENTWFSTILSWVVPTAIFFRSLDLSHPRNGG